MPDVSLLTFEEFLRLEADWDGLASSTAAPLPFMTHGWLRVWWAHFGRDQQFVAPIVRRQGRLVAAVPLVLRRARLAGLGLTVAEIAGTGPVPTRGMGLADKSDLLVARDDPAALAPLCREIERLVGRVDLLDLKGLDSSSPALCELSLAGSQRLERSASPYVALGVWDDYLAGRSGNFRKHLKKNWRLLDEAGPTRIETLTSGQGLPAMLQEMLAVNQASWKAGRGTNLYRHPRLRAFMIDVLTALAARNRVDLQLLWIKETAAAYELCFDFAGRLYSYDSAFRGGLERLSPGTALTAAVIRAACERGREEYDLLRGDEQYKQRWSADERHECQVLAPSPRIAARLYTMLGPRLKHRLKRQRWIGELADRVRGLQTRLRYN